MNVFFLLSLLWGQTPCADTWTTDQGNVTSKADIAASLGLVCVDPSPSNSPPAITNPGSQTNTDGDSVSLQVQASDPDGDSFVLSDSGLPGGLSMSPSGLISGTAIPVGVYPVVIVGDDGTDTSQVNFTWTVDADEPPPPPVSGLNFAEVTVDPSVTGTPFGAVCHDWNVNGSVECLVNSHDGSPGTLYEWTGSRFAVLRTPTLKKCNLQMYAADINADGFADLVCDYDGAASRTLYDASVGGLWFGENPTSNSYSNPNGWQRQTCANAGLSLPPPQPQQNANNRCNPRLPQIPGTPFRMVDYRSPGEIFEQGHPDWFQPNPALNYSDPTSNGWMTVWPMDLDGDGDYEYFDWPFINGDFLRPKYTCGMDFDGDGDLDLLGSARNSNTKSHDPYQFFENVSGALVERPGAIVDVQPRSGKFRYGILNCADIDNDGDIDFLSTDGAGTDPHWLMINDGANNFTRFTGDAPWRTLPGQGSQMRHGSHLIDFDGDGCIDVVTDKNDNPAMAAFRSLGCD